MKLRHPSPADVETLIDLGRAAHAESWYASLPFDEDVTRATIHAALDAQDALPLVAVTASGEIVGFLLAAITGHFFSHARYACDVVLYVTPKHRGSDAFRRLVTAYEAWARIKNVDEIVLGFSSGVAPERAASLYRKMGYEQTLAAYRKKCVQHN